MELTQRQAITREIASRRNYSGRSGITGPDIMAQVILDKNGEVVIDGNDLASLRTLLSGQFGIRFQSTGDAASIAHTRIIMETVDASPANPHLVRFDQLILTPFTGPGQFDLVERDASDVDVFDEDGDQVSGGESQVTLATKSGFTGGDTTGAWSRLVKVVTSDKYYSVVFVPGTAGDGIYSISILGLSQDQTAAQPFSFALPVVEPLLA